MSEVEEKVKGLLLAAVKLLRSGSPITELGGGRQEYVVSEESYLELLQRVDDIGGGDVAAAQGARGAVDECEN